VAVAAVRASDHVIGSQHTACAYGNRFLPDIFVRDTRNLVRVHQLDHALLKAPDQKHPIICFAANRGIEVWLILNLHIFP
jgi:hypothetical protein